MNNLEPIVPLLFSMMNIQLLLEAELLTSNSTYTSMATSHANKTLQNHVRSDFSSFHVVDYSPTTGKVMWRGTAQGYSNSSSVVFLILNRFLTLIRLLQSRLSVRTWSRGQSWAIYGFATMYSYTSNTKYLDTSRFMAQWYLDHLPSSGVAYWYVTPIFFTTIHLQPSYLVGTSMHQSQLLMILHHHS